ETLAIQVQQAMAMAVLLGAQPAKFLRLSWIARLQPIREIIVDAGVFFFERDGQGQNLLLVEALESAHVAGSPRLLFHLRGNRARLLQSSHPSSIIIRVELP